MRRWRDGRCGRPVPGRRSRSRTAGRIHDIGEAVGAPPPDGKLSIPGCDPPGVAIEPDQGHPRRRQQAHPGLTGHHCAGARILQHPRQALCRIGRVEGQVGRTRLDDREQRHHQRHRAFEADAHQATGGHAEGGQVNCELVGSRINLAVGENLVTEAERLGSRCAFGPDGEELGKGGLAGIGGGGFVPAPKHLPELSRRENWQLEKPFLGSLHHLTQQVLEAATQALDRRGVEEIGAVFEAGAEPCLGFGDGQEEIELRQVATERQPLDRQARELRVHGPRVLQCEHDLEQG